MALTVGKAGPASDFRKFMEKRLQIYLNGNRLIVGVLRGYDTFMNLVLDNTVEIKKDENIEIGIVVIRGNSISYWECLDKVTIK
ncbi:small nuclear ribonucleoprotein G, putative [Plasmodium vinckei]|uniref:Small nuclear ribonucleoprotein G n=6 Tax=Plasmodium (Vinckeia) TaxID=418101 RepID=A0AAE9WM57_PLAYO|nr:small nuclear ribonucleoprotein G, putative [Plasmodium yoelii]EAA19613.1 putative small nuclear ribonucleoprotein polypeptide G [Plasmodium yoelii yoelii]EUD70647.1 small nuclear ribonucleoprotein G [Plasmodium vinckei petteri]CAD2088947.1 small nuclear ribonucleoprotein G, putative [Plasmodium vinckei brucechwatti]CAD2101352.1 small nuclear ribonucleoprotein G, putative [Plasmodium vinckei]WBY56305.1 small nuclear ribonucleoprotein G [Plasmodium yoelii yoelii]|eukprot:XP_728048.1 small nuclear ribonucleoprotein G, putative [Plasmodium yoelii]